MNKKRIVLLLFVMGLWFISALVSLFSACAKNNVIETEGEAIKQDDRTRSGTTGSAGIMKEMHKILDIVVPENLPVTKSRLSTDMVGTAPPIEVMNVVSLPQIRQESIPTEPLQMYTNPNGLNIRQEPDVNSPIVTSVAVGTAVISTGMVKTYSDNTPIENWTRVQYNGKEGYVKSEFLSEEYQTISMGTFDITYYCPCAACCDIANRQTASGVWPVEGVTIAADPAIPFGTELVIDGQVYIVQDRGGKIKGNKIDIFLTSHDESLKRGTHSSEVYVKVWGAS